MCWPAVLLKYLTAPFQERGGGGGLKHFKEENVIFNSTRESGTFLQSAKKYKNILYIRKK